MIVQGNLFESFPTAQASDKLCHAIQLGFGAAVCVCEPDSADEFLAESAVLFESIFEQPARKKLGRVDQRKKE